MIRWQNYVSPNVQNDEWGHDDNVRLIKLHAEHSNHWKDIAPRFPGRTDNCVKNQLFSILRKALRKLSRHFLKDEVVPAINEIKPKIVTEFLRNSIAADPDPDFPLSDSLETVHDLVQHFVAHQMSEAVLDVSPAQDAVITECFKEIYKMKWAHQREIQSGKGQQAILNIPGLQEEVAGGACASELLHLHHPSAQHRTREAAGEDYEP